MAKIKPDQTTNWLYTALGVIGIIAWFAVDAGFGGVAGTDPIYGMYGGLLMGVLAAIVAKVKGRNPVAWFALGSWFVLLALIVLAFLGRLHEALCPHCREPVSTEATVCPHCARDIAASAA